MYYGVMASLLFVCVLPSDMDHQKATDARPAVEKQADIQHQLPKQEWMTSYAEARQLAIRHQVPMLLHFDARWCGACRIMEKQVLEKPQVKNLLGRQLIGVRLDADRNKDLIREYGITTLPTEVVVQPDGSKGPLMRGSVSLSSYVARLNRIAAEKHRDALADTTEEQTDRSTHMCLIENHEGRMVGMGGYCPVTLVRQKKWRKGDRKFVASHEGVDYFLSSAEAQKSFLADPQKYIPELHGCDVVALQQQNRVTAGAIEYGSIYRGRYFFFASLENRNRFKRNPAWYADVRINGRTQSDIPLPLIGKQSMQN